MPVTGALRISDERALVDAAVAGAGVLLGCRSLLMGQVREGRLVRLLPRYEVPSLPINVLFAAKSDMPKIIRRFLDWIVVEAEESRHGTRMRLTTYLPAATPPEVIERHLRHLCMEFQNWAAIADPSKHLADR